MKLSEVRNNETVVITKILGHGSFRKRISEMGFVKGKEIRVIKNAPFNGAIEYKILNYNISLRRSEAERIEVVPAGEYIAPDVSGYEGVISLEDETFGVAVRGKTINVALVGNPNSGKTTLYNGLSGAREKVGNYCGVTVDIRKSSFDAFGYRFNVCDLPGTYSLTAYTPEEIYVRKFIYEETPDIVINVLEATNLERSLFLTTQLIDMDLRIVAALNMYDELEEQSQSLSHENLGKLLGIPFVPTVSTRGEGFEELLKRVICVYEGNDPVTRHIHINYGSEIESSLKVIRRKIKENKPITDKISSRFLALKMLEKDKHVLELLSDYPNYMEIVALAHREITRMEGLYGEESESVVTDAKYAFISGALKETLREQAPVVRNLSEKIDRIITHPKLAFPIFAGILFLVFWGTFTLGAYPMGWIDSGIGWLSNGLRSILPEGMLKELLIDGIISGTGSVLVFLPNILILFFFIALLEGTGYMARAAFIMDKIMHRFGLHGRSFIPMIMGFGCNVPAIMATRTLRNKGDRILTMLIVPFMSCSARLPVYILIISAFFTSHQALILICIYAFGIILAFLTAQILNRLFFRNKEIPFVMELPAYRMPTLKNIFFHMWDKSRHYLRKIGTVILIGVIIIWVLEYFPRTAPKQAVGAPQEQPAQVHTAQVKPGATGIATPVANEVETPAETVVAAETLHLSHSYLGRLGKMIEPAMSPLGFDWKMSVALLAGLPAKEIIISTLGVLYQTNVEESTVNLQVKLQNEVHTSGKLRGKPVFTTASALAFLVFILVYFPCIGVVATIGKESGHWKWSLISVVYTTLLAWVLAFITYQGINLFL
ncbi:MAG: ferrous iron transport protein B [Prolixibacteraceae bacterium]|nr:ferrous iron transport protein B [Prolixibacteraceae bacterium]